MDVKDEIRDIKLGIEMINSIKMLINKKIMKYRLEWEILIKAN